MSPTTAAQTTLSPKHSPTAAVHFKPKPKHSPAAAPPDNASEGRHLLQDIPEATTQPPTTKPANRPAYLPHKKPVKRPEHHYGRRLRSSWMGA
jgi:hypothetical protein